MPLNLMWEMGKPRGKTRRASPPEVSAPSDSSSSTTTTTPAAVAVVDPSWHEAIFPHGEAGSLHEPVTASEVMELHRRCFSCCNAVLQQEASLLRGDERVMVSTARAYNHSRMSYVSL